MTTSSLEAARKCLLFSGLKADEINDALSAFSVVNFVEGAVILSKNTENNKLLIITAGEVTVSNEDLILATLSPAELVGESSLTGNISTATLKAKTTVECLEIDKEGFLKLSAQYPQLPISVVKIVFQRLKSSNETALQEAHNRERILQEKVDERTEQLQETLRGLEQSKAVLEETAKFKDQFLASMSHEIRTPMNAITGMVRLMLNRNQDKENLKYLNAVKQSADNLLVIINDILDFSKIQAGKMDVESIAVNLSEVLAGVQNTLNFKADEKKITLAISVADDVPQTIASDPTRLTQVLLNLVGNAIKFTSEGEVRVLISKQNIGHNKEVLKVEVIDFGIGILAENLAKLFQSFSQAESGTTRKYGGTGLGLSISKQLVELMGGHIGVKSEWGKGSNFWFTLPLKKMEADVKPEIIESKPITLPPKLRILLVEDNDFNVMVAEDTLKELIPDVQLTIAENGQIAIDILAKEMFDLVLMDIQMPEMDGYIATEFIRNQLPEPIKSIKICAMTAGVTQAEIEKCFAVGMNDFVPKPFEPKELLAKIGRLVGED